MFTLVFLIGCYSYIIFFIGLLGLLNKEILLAVTITYIFLTFFVIRNKVLQAWTQISLKKVWAIRNKPSTALLFVLIFLQVGINLLGALGPELGFDALWYHLTMPKIYLQSGKIFYIGGHLYYSAMPQLTEMYYLVSLALGNEITAKVIHFLFGILSLIAVYKLSRLFLSVKYSILTALIFYSNLVVGWMSITAYIDLTRTFFEIMALWAFFYFVQTNKLKWFSISAIMVGFAISTKILSIGSIILYIFLLFYLKFSSKLQMDLAKLVVIYTGLALATALPWLLYSYLNTGNPLYPIFTPGFQQMSNPLSLDLIQSLKKAVQIFLLSPDPISPIYFISLPLIAFHFLKKGFIKNSREILLIQILTIYVSFNLITLYFTPIESSGRFILPFLPAFSLLFVIFLKNLQNKFIYNLLFITIIVISLSSIFYRGIANKRFIPLLAGKITKQEFMANNMDFQVGNFYDIDRYFQKNITKDDRVLIYGISNLFYVNFPYISSTWSRKDDKFNYILTKDMKIPEKYKSWKLIYQNPISRIKLYKINEVFKRR